MIRVLIVDDHAIVRDGMGLVLRRIAPDVELIHAETLRDAVEALSATPVALVLLDDSLPDALGEASLPALLRVARQAPVVVFSGDDRPRRVRRMLDLGARGYLPKSLSNERMAAAIAFVLDGGTYLPECLLRKPCTRAFELGLTPRQHEVLALLVEGLSNQEIAAALGTSESTARAHVSAIFRALGVDNRTQAVTFAITQRLV